MIVIEKADYLLLGLILFGRMNLAILVFRGLCVESFQRGWGKRHRSHVMGRDLPPKTILPIHSARNGLTDRAAIVY